MIKLSSDGGCMTLGKTAYDAEPRLSRHAHLSQHGGMVVSWPPVWQMLGSKTVDVYHMRRGLDKGDLPTSFSL